ncbi:MAG: ABC transporter ATP-binding protein [Lactobacillaceae bacterium]|nr:ABC transporter ATP-binding protein [Lactobacillaceae bacterium]
MLQVNHLKKQYGDFKAVNDISFTINQGEILAFLEPNGAGKTTTIKMILNLIVPTAGKVVWDNQVLNSQHQKILANIGAVLEGSRNLYWRLSPVENFEYWGGIRGIRRKVAIKQGLEYLEMFDLLAKKDTPVRELSRGMQQIVAICTSLIHQPKLLLLDEPTLGLDVAASERIQKIVRQLAQQQNMAVLLTTHEMAVAQNLSDRVVMINHRKIVFEDQTKIALQSFQREIYQLTFSHSLPTESLQQLAQYGQLDQLGESSYQLILASPTNLPAILLVLAELPLLSLKKVDLNLETLFKSVINESRVGQ